MLNRYIYIYIFNNFNGSLVIVKRIERYKRNSGIMVCSNGSINSTNFNMKKRMQKSATNTNVIVIAKEPNT